MVAPAGEWFADSIPYGTGCSVVAGPRESMYFAGQADQLYGLAGAVNWAGTGGGLANNPWCDCVPGITTSGLNSLLSRINTYRPQFVIYSGGINDVVAGDSAATIVASISTGLDDINTRLLAVNPSGIYRIVLTYLLKNLDPTLEAGAVAVNALLPAMVAGKSYASKVVLASGIYDLAIPNPVIGVNMADNTHPNDTGANLYGAYFYSAYIRAVVVAVRGANR